MRDFLQHSEELFVNSCFNQALCGAKAAPTPPDVGDEYSTYRRTLAIIHPMNEALTILEIAFEDLEASKLLLQNNHYPQSIFYFQQAVEKTTKSIGLSQGFLKKEDLQIKIRHNTLKIFKKAIEFASIPDEILKNLSDDFNLEKEFNEVQSFAKEVDIELLMPTYISQIEDYKSTDRKQAIDIPKLHGKQDYLNLIDSFNIDIDEIENIRQKPEDDDFFRIQCEKLNNLMSSLPKFAEKVMILHVMALIVIELVNDVRYPNLQDFTRPSLIYDSNHVIVKNLKYLLDELDQCIKLLLKFIMV